MSLVDSKYLVKIENVCKDVVMVQIGGRSVYTKRNEMTTFCTNLSLNHGINSKGR